MPGRPGGRILTKSLRARLLFGAAWWTVGLFLATLVVSTALMLQSRHVARLMHGVAYSHAFWFALVALACMAAGVLQMRRGVSAIDQLRGRLSSVHAGRERRVEGTYPAEVQPLVDDLNALIDHQEETVRRALSKAGDLAHGLKTPLAVLAQEADRAGAHGQDDLAATIALQVERMRRHVDYHLAHARAAASGATPGASCQVLVSADALARTLQRLHADGGVTIHVRVDPAHVVRTQREDLDEMLGNLLDNACKWAAGSVAIASNRLDGEIAVVVEDDGPGIAEDMREAVLQRGVRADEAAPGSGFGLAIVRDIAELYGGSITLSAAPAGGLRATLRLPAAAG